MSVYQDDYARLQRAMRRLAIAVGVFVGALCLLIAMLWWAALSATAARAESPAEPGTEALMVIPVAIWEKVERALVFWHAEAQRYKAMKGCT